LGTELIEDFLSFGGIFGPAVKSGLQLPSGKHGRSGRDLKEQNPATGI
jgi:hypothetical protein